MSEHYTDRRTVLRAVGTGAVGSTLLSGIATAGSQLDAELQRVRAATRRYEDPRRAISDGFRLTGPFVPGMGWHFINSRRVKTAASDGLSVQRPQILTYGDTGAAEDGELVLAAVEYAIPLGARGYTEENPPDLFSDTNGSEQWHVHRSAEHALALPVSQDTNPEQLPADVPLPERLRTSRWLELVTGASEPTMERGTVIAADFVGGEALDSRVIVDSSMHPDLLTLHVYVHHENPNGVFTAINPNLPSDPVA